MSRIFSKNMVDFLNLQTANTRKIGMIQAKRKEEVKQNTISIIIIILSG